jgi:pimeloyl-ACP methyl ester carboxylesterase
VGADEGPQIVLVHGIGVASRYFRRLAAVLSGSAGVHALELPGFGGAPKPRAPLSVEALAAVVNSYVRSADLVSPVLVGHSMGSQVVLEAALQAPGRAATVVAMGPVVDPSARTAWQQGLRLLLDLLLEPPSANWAVLRDYARTGPVWYFRTVPIMLAYRSEGTVGQIRTPLLVMRGARDPIAGHDWAAQLQRLAPTARLVEVPRAAHVLMHSHPDEVAAEILSHHAAVVERST